MKFKITSLNAILFFAIIFPIVAIHAMEPPKDQLISESTEDFTNDAYDGAIKGFEQLINNKINAMRLKKPKTLLDGIVQLNQLFRNLEVNFNESNFSFLGFHDDLLINDSRIPSHALFLPLSQAFKSILEKNVRVNSLIEFVVEKLAKNVTKNNKGRCITLVEKYLPSIVSKQVKKQCAEAYGWYDNERCMQREISIESKDFYKHLPLDSSRIASASVEGFIKIWNIKTRECETYLEGCPTRKEDIDPIHFDYNAENILAMACGNTIKVWNIKTGECLKTFTYDNLDIYAIKFINTTNFQAKFSKENFYYTGIFDIRTGKSLINVSHIENTLIPLKNGQFISGSYVPHGLTLWDKNGKFLKSQHTWSTFFTAHNKKITDLLTINDATLASASKDKTIKIWDLNTWQCKKTLRGHTYGVSILKALNNNLIVSGSFMGSRTNQNELKNDQSVKIWNINTGECLQTFDGFEKSNLGYSLVVTDNAIITCNEQTMRIIYKPTFEQTINFLAKKNDDTSCAIS